MRSFIKSKEEIVENIRLLELLMMHTLTHTYGSLRSLILSAGV